MHGFEMGISRKILLQRKINVIKVVGGRWWMLRENDKSKEDERARASLDHPNIACSIRFFDIVMKYKKWKMLELGLHMFVISGS